MRHIKEDQSQESQNILRSTASSRTETACRTSTQTPFAGAKLSPRN